MSWADEADLFIFLLDGASHGVGMELQNALMRKYKKLPEAQILGLVHVNHYEKLSSFIKGIRQENFRLMVYTTEDIAKKYVEEFLEKYE